jgi:hypothetical protein
MNSENSDEESMVVFAAVTISRHSKRPKMGGVYISFHLLRYMV